MDEIVWFKQMLIKSIKTNSFPVIKKIEWKNHVKSINDYILVGQDDNHGHKLGMLIKHQCTLIMLYMGVIVIFR